MKPVTGQTPLVGRGAAGDLPKGVDNGDEPKSQLEGYTVYIEGPSKLAFNIGPS